MNKLIYGSLIEKIHEKETFAFSRYGDGEWNAILGKVGANCDGHEYFESLGKALRNVLISRPNYYLGLQSLAMRVIGLEITKFVTANNIRPISEWGDADILHKASIKEMLPQFFEALDTTPYVLLVAPEYLKQINKYFKYNAIVEVPTKNCWLHYKRIEYDILAILNEQTKYDNYVVVLFMAGMSSNVLIDALYNLYTDKVTLIDAGSVFDPFVGRNTRSYHKKLNIPPA